MKAVRRQGRGPVIGKFGWDERREALRVEAMVK